MGENSGSGSVKGDWEQELSALSEICEALARSSTTVDAVAVITGKMKTVCDFQSLVLFVIRRDTGDMELEPRLVVSPYAEQVENESADFREGAAGWVITHLKPLLFQGSGEVELPRLIEDERSALVVPMVAGNEEVGVLYVGAAEPCSYDGRTCLRLSIVASQCAMAIRSAEIRENVREYIIIDGVTGLYTHRFFQRRLIEACREYEGSLKSFSLVMIDLDHFMRYNDTLGHLEGDKILRESAALIRSYTRDSDVVCRYGGDEFVIILKESDKENSVRTAERIREAFQYRFHTYPVKITASIGVANFPEDATDKIDLVSAADAALYRSKTGGRNQLNVAPSLRRGDDSSQSGGEGSQGSPGSPSPSNVPVSRRPPGISFGNVCEIPDEPGTMSTGDSEEV